MSHHVVFLEHIYFFSIPFATHDLTTYDLICIDHNFEDSDGLSSPVPNTSNSLSLVLPHFPLHYNRRVRASSAAGTDTLLSGTPEAPSSTVVSQSPFEIVYPPLHPSTRVCKSTKLLDVAYSCYFSSFTSFLASIHRFFELSFYKEAILDPCW